MIIRYAEKGRYIKEIGIFIKVVRRSFYRYLADITYLCLQIQRSDYSSRNNWRSFKSNPWSENNMARSWLDVRLKRQAKRSNDGEKRIRVLWDVDGHTLEQVYVYYEEEPGLWTAEQLRPPEKELISKGIGLYFTFLCPCDFYFYLCMV